MPQADSKSYSELEQQKTPYPYPQQFEDETVDLYELWITIWNRRWLISGVTVIAALGSIVYALQLEPIYKAQALLLPPKAKDVQSMNVLGILNSPADLEASINLLPVNSANTVFTQFKQNLNSRTLHKKFILENGLMEILAPDRTPGTRNEFIYMGFAKLIKLKDEKGVTSISIELKDKELASKWVNDLIEFVNQETIAMMVEDLRKSIANYIRDVEYKIASKRQMAKQRREDRIIQFEEAASIANELGILDRVDSTSIVQNKQLNITTTNIPIYFRGYRSLMAEISHLENRVSDDPFISGLRDLQEQLALLRTIKFDGEKMNAVHIDQAAYPPKYPFKPNRRLIVSLTTVVGFFSSVFLAFLITFVKNQKKKHSELTTTP